MSIGTGSAVESPAVDSQIGAAPEATVSKRRAQCQGVRARPHVSANTLATNKLRATIQRSPCSTPVESAMSSVSKPSPVQPPSIFLKEFQH